MPNGVWNGGVGYWNDAANWSSNVVPSVGDAALIEGGTVVEANADLSGALIDLVGPTPETAPTLVLNNVTLGYIAVPVLNDFTQGSIAIPGLPGADQYANFVVSGTVVNSLNLEIFGGGGDSHLTIGIDQGTLLNTGRIATNGFLTIEAAATDGSATFENDGTVVQGAAAATTVVGAPVTGSGTFDVYSSSRDASSLVFPYFVSSGQTIDFHGGATAPTITVNDPANFHASLAYTPDAQSSVAAGTPAWSVLMPTATATSETYDSGQLNLFNGDTQIAAFNIAGDFTTGNFALSSPASGGTLLSFVPNPTPASTPVPSTDSLPAAVALTT